MKRYLHEIGEAVIKIQEALKHLKIDATEENSASILYCHRKCGEVLDAIGRAASADETEDAVAREKEDGVNGNDS